MKKKYQSEILKVLHEDAQGLYKIGAIDEVKMREFDEACLVHGAPQSNTPTALRSPFDKLTEYKEGARTIGSSAPRSNSR